MRRLVLLETGLVALEAGLPAVPAVAIASALSVEPDVVFEDIDLGSEFGYDLSVHCDDAGLDKGVSLAA